MIPWVNKKRNSCPVLKGQRALLYVDGHISHEDPEAVQALSDHQIDVYELFPHSSLVTQPLDLTVFNPWRVNLRKVGGHVTVNSHALFAEIC